MGFTFWVNVNATTNASEDWMGNLKKFTKLSDIDMQISFNLFSLCGFRLFSPADISKPISAYM